MIDQILAPVGIPYAETVLPDPPRTDYAIYMDDVETDGADGVNLIRRHEVTIELYAVRRGSPAETLIDEQLDASGVHWTKQARYWLPSIKRFETVYEFTYYEKRRA